jgi:hypothetical protein
MIKSKLKSIFCFYMNILQYFVIHLPSYLHHINVSLRCPADSFTQKVNHLRYVPMTSYMTVTCKPGWRGRGKMKTISDTFRSQNRNQGCVGWQRHKRGLTMTGSLVMIRQKTTDLKRKFRERTEERRNRMTAIRDEAKLAHAISRNSSSDESSTKSNMMNFAIASSTIASDCSSHLDYHKASKHSNLYQQSSKQEPTKIVYPNLNKRDIYLATRKESKPAKIIQREVNTRGAMSDISNGLDEAKTSLPAFSLTGSMLCRELENGHIRSNGTTANQTMLSPPKPLILPANTITASMLFRTLQQEEEKTKTSRSTGNSNMNQYARKFFVPEEVLPSPAAKSVVSELTQHTKDSEVDPKMVDASHNLLRILQMNQFEQFEVSGIKRHTPHRNPLYEA